MIAKPRRIKITEIIFFTALSSYLIVQLLSSTLISALFDYKLLRLPCFFAVICLLTLKLIIDNSHRYLWIYFVLLVMFLLVGLYATNIRDLLILGFLTLEARDIDLRKIIKTDVVLIGIVLVGIILLYFLGLFREVDITTVRSGDMTTRLSLGFGWTTYAPNYFLSFVTGVLFLNPKRKYKWLLASSVLLINYLLYIATDTRAAYYETFALVLFVLLIDIFRIDIFKYRISRIIILLTYIISAGFSIWISVNYTNSNPIMRMINEFTSYRLSLAHRALELYSVGLWGNPVEWVIGNAVGQKAYFYVDSSYVQILIQFGVLVFAYVIILFTFLMRHYMYRQNSIAVICLIIIAVHSIADPQLFNLVYNPFLLGLGMSLKEWTETTNIIKKGYLNKSNRYTVKNRFVLKPIKHH